MLVPTVWLDGALPVRTASPGLSRVIKLGEECVSGRDMSEKWWIRFGIGTRSVHDRDRPWVSRVEISRSRSRFSTVVGLTLRRSPIRASDQPEL